MFILRKPDDSGFRAYDPARRGLHVAGMFRHIASQPEIVRSVGWSDEDARRIILGHGETRGDEHKPVQGGRIAFLPLPSIEMREGSERVVGSIRRVLATARGNLAPQGVPPSHSTPRRSGTHRRKNRRKSPLSFSVKATATARFVPISRSQQLGPPSRLLILPGYDDPRKLRRRLDDPDAPLATDEKTELLRKLDARIEHLLRKAIVQSGFLWK